MIYQGKMYLKYYGTTIGGEIIENEFLDNVIEIPIELHDKQDHISLNFKFSLPEYHINSLFIYRLNCKNGENEYISLFDDFSMSIESVTVLKDKIVLLGSYNLLFFSENRVINYNIAVIFNEIEVKNYFADSKVFPVYWDLSLL